MRPDRYHGGVPTDRHRKWIAKGRGYSSPFMAIMAAVAAQRRAHAMAIVLPQLDDAPAFAGMAVQDSVDDFVRISDKYGTFVETGCQVTQDTGSDMKVAVAAGRVAIQGNDYAYAGTGASPLTIPAASTGDRRDTIVLRLSAGVVSAVCVEGSVPTSYPGSTPLVGAWTVGIPPSTSLPPKKGPMNNNPGTTVSTSVNVSVDVVLAEVYVAFNTTTITGTATTILNPTTGNIVDKTANYLFPGTSSFETATRLSSPDQLRAMQANLAGSGFRATGWGAGILSTDLAQVGQLAGLQYPFIEAGCVWTAQSTGTTLAGLMSSGVAVIGGVALTVAAVGASGLLYAGVNNATVATLNAGGVLALNVAIPANTPTAGSGQIVTSGATQSFTFTGWSGSTLTGVVIAGTTTNTVPTGAIMAFGRTFTASRDTYVDLANNGDGTANITYTEVGNNAGSPALANSGTVLNTIRNAIVVSTGSALTTGKATINQGDPNIAAPATTAQTSTVAVGSNGANITATTLSVAANSLPTAGRISIAHSTMTYVLDYTGGGGTTTLTGVTVVSGNGTVSTSDVITVVACFSMSDSLGNPIFNTDPYPTLIALRAMGIAVTTTATSAVPVNDLKAPMIVPYIIPPGPSRRVKLWASLALFGSTAAAGTQLTIQLSDGNTGTNTSAIAISLPKVKVASDPDGMFLAATMLKAPGSYTAQMWMAQGAAGTLSVGSLLEPSQFGVELV